MSENLTIQNWKQFDSKYRKDDIDSKFAIQLSACTNLGFLLDNNTPKFTWTDPQDVVLNGSVLSTWNQTVLVKKLGSYPTNHTDGTVVATTSRANENKNYYRDHSFTDINSGNGEYYYMLFSETTTHTWNNLTANKISTNQTNITWQQVRQFVQAGRGSQIFPVGTTFIVNHPQYTTSTGESGIAFTVLGHDQVTATDQTVTHTMCLGSEILFKSAFDTNELEYAITEDVTTQTGKKYYTFNGSTYTELIENTDWSHGDAIPEATYYEKNVNYRSSYGNNNFMESNILQWANSDGTANNWFVKQNIWDRCVAPLISKNGFIKYIDSDFLSVVKQATLITAKRKEEGGGSYTTNAKFWLLSKSQVTGVANNSVMENTELTYYTTNSKIKQFEGTNTGWWLRTPITDNSYQVTFILPSGVSTQNTANTDIYGISLACIIG